ncbi:hypothetical protein V6N13_017336 [Hibiscus sabdariffa]|uniref:Uncharacterized protein n=1 Tax=Hibiscus sabdariffa TaxID=183260 RepID=A0ABR2CZ08_9ROSI
MRSSRNRSNRWCQTSSPCGESTLFDRVRVSVMLMLILDNDLSSTHRNVVCPSDPLLPMWFAETGELLPHTCMAMD